MRGGDIFIQVYFGGFLGVWDFFYYVESTSMRIKFL